MGFVLRDHFADASDGPTGLGDVVATSGTGEPTLKKGGGKKSGATFAGYATEALGFLADLAQNNDKAWFEANRALYERVLKGPTAGLVTAVSEALRARDLPLEGDPKRSGFRIHRDTRFSKNKSPYKTNVGTVWYRQGSGKDGAGILYFHLAPEGCFVAAAFYMPEAETLGAIRERIRVQPGQFHAMVAALQARALHLDAGDTLVRMPRGFEDLADTPLAPALKLKSFIVRREVLPSTVCGVGLVPAIVDLAADALPLLRFGWAAVDEVR